VVQTRFDSPRLTQASNIKAGLGQKRETQDLDLLRHV